MYQRKAVSTVVSQWALAKVTVSSFTTQSAWATLTIQTAKPIVSRHSLHSLVKSMSKIMSHPSHACGKSNFPQQEPLNSNSSVTLTSNTINNVVMTVSISSPVLSMAITKDKVDSVAHVMTDFHMMAPREMSKLTEKWTFSPLHMTSEITTPSLVSMLINHSLVVDSLSNGTHTKCTNMISPMFSKLMNSSPRLQLISSTMSCSTPTEVNSTSDPLPVHF